MKGNFRRAATHKQNLAELYEVELGDQKKALEAYDTAAGWFEQDGAEAYVLQPDVLCREVLTNRPLQPSKQALPQDSRHIGSRRRLLQVYLKLRAGGQELNKQ